MKRLLGIIILGLVLGSNAFAESKLPSCEGNDVSKWTNCFGTYDSSNTSYVWSDSSKSLSLKRNEGGIGIRIDTTEKFRGTLKVVSVRDNSAASKAGVKIGDDIIRVDGILLHGKTVQESINLLTGPIEASVEITIRRKGEKKVIVKNIIRESLKEWGKLTPTQYVGEWKNGKFHGQGTFISKNGSKYVGEFKDGNYHGQGTYTYADGIVEKGIFKDGKFIKSD